MDTNKPVETLRDGSLKAVIWSNETKDGGAFHTVALSRTYEDRNGQLQDTNSFSANELPRVARLTDEAYGRVLDMKREQSRDRRAEQTRETAPETTPERFRNRAQPGMER